MKYAGIGSREAPQYALNHAADTAVRLAISRWTLCSGAALGMDSAFEEGHRRATDDRIEIYLPWIGYNHHSSDLHELPDEAFEIAAAHHPAWYKCSHPVRKLHARNSLIILGPELSIKTKVDMVLCWTKDRKATGGTGQAIRIANNFDIPVYYL